MKIPNKSASQSVRVNLEAIRLHNAEEFTDVLDLGETIANELDTFEEAFTREAAKGHYTHEGLRTVRRRLAEPVIAFARKVEERAEKAEATVADSLSGYWSSLLSRPKDVLDYLERRELRDAFRSLDIVEREAHLLHAARSGNDAFLRAVLTGPEMPLGPLAEKPGHAFPGEMFPVTPAKLAEVKAVIADRVGAMGTDQFRARELRGFVRLALETVHGDDRLAADDIAELAAKGQVG
jgi:hypothetical protein